MTEMKEWLAARGERDGQLYVQYGKRLERDHTGEYAAIGPDGQIVLGPVAAEMLRQAVEAFGSSNFALKRVGHRTFGRWLTVSV